MTQLAPVISVIVPTRNRPVALARCLTSLAQQDLWPEAFEIVVVDDGSMTPVTVDAALAARTRVRVLRQEHAGPATARNLGIQRAAGTFVAFTDDDCVADRTWLSALVKALADNPGAGIGGQVVNALAGNAWSEASQLLVGFLYGYYNRDPSRRGSSAATTSRFGATCCSRPAASTRCTYAPPRRIGSCVIAGPRPAVA